MTATELQTIEVELKKRGYRKYTGCSTSNESWAWFKSFGKDKDDDGKVVAGYQIAFRIWDWRRYIESDPHMYPYGLDMWTSPLSTDFRMDFTSNWTPIADIDTFERMAAEFNQMVRRYINNPQKEERI